MEREAVTNDAERLTRALRDSLAQVSARDHQEAVTALRRMVLHEHWIKAALPYIPGALGLGFFVGAVIGLWMAGAFG